MILNLLELYHDYLSYFLESDLIIQVLILTPAFWIEFPLFFFMILSSFYYHFFKTKQEGKINNFYPPLGIIITAFKESDKEILRNLRTILYQEYPSLLEIIIVFDTQRETKYLEKVYLPPKRKLRIITKFNRGGRASSLNLGLKLLSKEIEFVVALDADTSLDYDALKHLIKPFSDPRVIAVSGNLKVRNYSDSIWTKFQYIEYVISITIARLFLSFLGTTNNISGAYGCFRRSFLEQIYGWDSGTAEDLNLTNRLKLLRSIYREARLKFVPESVARTSVPSSLSSLLKQRQRWDGDLVWLFFKKYKKFWNPNCLKWQDFITFLDLNFILQFLMPVAMLFYLIYLLLKYGSIGFIVINLFILSVYTFWIFLLYVSYLINLSLEKSKDYKFLLYTILYPLYNWFLRLHALKAYIDDWLLDLHRYSTYVPKWVSRRLPY